MKELLNYVFEVVVVFLDKFLNQDYTGNDHIKLYSRRALAQKIASLL